MLCDFANETLTCPRCQFKAGNRHWRRVCPETPRSVQRSPALLQRLKNFSRAAIAHALSGSPTCTQEQIDERLMICRACEMFQPNAKQPEVGVCTHSKCGCKIRREEKFASKLAWADQECPLGKWGRLDTPPSEATVTE